MLIECREEKPSEVQSIYSLNCEAFETEAEAQLVDTLRKANKLILSLVAVDGDKVVGHIAFSPMNLASQGDRMLAGLGPMAVAKSRQKQGIGAQLIQAGENRLKELGYDAIFVLGHKEYYPKFGYKPRFQTLASSQSTKWRMSTLWLSLYLKKASAVCQEPFCMNPSLILFDCFWRKL
jgi:putative acetyltransferase